MPIYDVEAPRKKGLVLPSELIDTSIWPQPEVMRTVNGTAIDGQAMAARKRKGIMTRAFRFEDYYKRKACLAVTPPLY